MIFTMATKIDRVSVIRFGYRFSVWFASCAIGVRSLIAIFNELCCGSNARFESDIRFDGDGSE